MTRHTSVFLLCLVWLAQIGCAAPTPTSPPFAPPDTPTPSPTEPAATPEAGPTIASTPMIAGSIKVGATVSDTGAFAEQGRAVRQGYTFWQQWTNQHGGVEINGLRYGVRLILLDDASDPAQTSALYEKLAAEDNVHWLLGPSAAELVPLAAAVAEAHGIPMVESASGADDLFGQGYTATFSLLASPGRASESALKLLADQGATRLAIAYDNNPPYRVVAAGTQALAGTLGITAVSTDVFPPGVVDSAPLLAKYQSLRADALAVIGGPTDAATFAQGIKKSAFAPSAILLTDGPGNAGFMQAAGDSAEGMLGLSAWDASAGWADDRVGSASDFATQYAAMWGDEQPDSRAAGAAACGFTLAAAAQQAGSFKPEDVLAALPALDMMTFFGPVKFGADGRNEARPMLVMQVQNGALAIVAPDNVKTSDVVYPLAK